VVEQSGAPLGDPATVAETQAYGAGIDIGLMTETGTKLD